jgi:hypothetical protein
MADTWLTVLFNLALAANLLGGLWALRSPAGPSRALAWAVAAANLAHWAYMVYLLGRPTLSGAYESLTLLSLVLALLAPWPLAGRPGPTALAGASWLAAGLLLAVSLAMSRKLYPDWFMYGFGWTRAFFTLRLTAVAIMAHAALAALVSLGRRAGPQARQVLLIRSRNCLLLGTAVFLAGEFCGFTWRLAWLGDYWSWSRNFLESTMYFLLATAGVHLPPRWSTDPRRRAWAQAAPGVVMVSLILLRLLTEAA